MLKEKCLDGEKIEISTKIFPGSCINRINREGKEKH